MKVKEKKEFEEEKRQLLVGISIRDIGSEGVSMRAGRSKGHSGCTRKRLGHELIIKTKHQ